jgi:phage terminase small subunit
MTTKISDKQESFLQRYVQDFNGSKSYRECYPNCKSDNNAKASAAKLLAKDNIKTRLAEILKEREERTKVDSTYVIEYLKGAVELDLDEFAEIGKKGITLKDFQDIDKSIKKYCTEVSQTDSKTRGIIVNFKVFSKEKAIEMLAKHTGATRERVELSGEVTVNSITDLVNSNT